MQHCRRATPSSHAFMTAFVMGGLLVAASGCRDRNPTSPPVHDGVLRVEVATFGLAAATGRVVEAWVVNETGTTFGAGNGRTHAAVALHPGSYSVTADLVFTTPPPTRLRFPLRCSWNGGNPKPATIVAGELTVLGFALDCTPPGGVMVTTNTTGPGAPPDGMIVWVEESARLWARYQGHGDDTVDYGGYPGEPVAANGFTTVDLSAGMHVVELRGLPLHCVVDGGTKRSVSISEDALTTVDLRISCN